ncbi:hypothetical protein [Clostridium niameyense]|uniref:hypothetical protein n=1 Tax=Clostridium niameyense TaxID=1622073 RepID=UPI00067F3CA2|nr:hypothetical protein [Clostridium niameyense]
MERSSFFNAVLDSSGVPDTVYLAEDFARYFATFIGNGVFPNPATGLQVVAINNDMQIIIKSGYAWINGYMYENTDDYIFKLDAADGVLDRIDRVVLRLDFLERKIKVGIKKGEWSSNAKAKDLQRDNDVFELALADVKISKGAISISQADITDLRLNKNLCGIVHGTVDQVDTTAIFDQYKSWYEQTKAKYEKNMLSWTTQKKQEFEDWFDKTSKELLQEWTEWFSKTKVWEQQWLDWFKNTETWEKEFNKWFEDIKKILDDNVAAKLTTQVLELQSKTKTLESQLQTVEGKIVDIDNKLDTKADKYIIDNISKDKYKIGIDNGLIYIEEVINDV